MTGKIKDRVVRLEGRLSPTVDQEQIERDAFEVTKRLIVKAAALSNEAADMTPDELLHMSCADHCAWAIRFDPEHSNPATIMALHGVA